VFKVHHILPHQNHSFYVLIYHTPLWYAKTIKEIFFKSLENDTGKNTEIIFYHFKGQGADKKVIV